jgi:hypothetical protein
MWWSEGAAWSYVGNEGKPQKRSSLGFRAVLGWRLRLRPERVPGRGWGEGASETKDLRTAGRPPPR